MLFFCQPNAIQVNNALRKNKCFFCYEEMQKEKEIIFIAGKNNVFSFLIFWDWKYSFF